MDDRPAAAPAPGRPPPQATTPVPPPGGASTTGPAEAGGFFALLEAVALAALGIDGTTQLTPTGDDRPGPDDNR